MIPDTDRALLERFAADCADALGSSLQAVLLYGEGATGHIVGKAPLTTVVVVDAVTTTMLRVVAEVSRRWRRSGLVTPLILDEEYLATSCDVFPLELLLLMDSHLLVRGSKDPLASLVLDHEHLRLEVEQQLKGKLLHLRQAYLEVDGGKRLRTLMLDSSEGFEAIMRGLLMLAGQSRATEATAVTTEVEQALGVRLDTFRRIQSARRNGGLKAGEAQRLFERYLEEIVALTRTAGTITKRTRRP